MGAIRLSQPASNWLVAAAALGISGCLVGFIAFGSFNKKARVTGITTPVGGTLSITASSTGTLVRQLVAEGAEVKTGQPLFELSTERHGAGGDVSALLAHQLAIQQQTLEAERRTRITQDSEKRHAVDARLLNLDAEQSQLAQEIALAQRRQELGQQSLKKFELLETSGFVSMAQAQQKQEELLDLSARLEALNRTKVQLSATRIGLQAERQASESDLAAALAQLDRAQASLRQEMVQDQDRWTTLITAPQNGMLTTLTNQTGQAVAAGQVLATLVPQRAAAAETQPELEVHLYAPSRTAGFVAVGQTVYIRYQAYPYQKFGLYQGRVVDVSKTPFAPNELPTNLASTILSNAQQNILGFNGNEALYRIKVKPLQQAVQIYGKVQALKPGMTLEADVLQERRKIWEWIIEPVLAMAH